MSRASCVVPPVLGLCVCGYDQSRFASPARAWCLGAPARLYDTISVFALANMIQCGSTAAEIMPLAKPSCAKIIGLLVGGQRWQFFGWCRFSFFKTLLCAAAAAAFGVSAPAANRSGRNAHATSFSCIVFHLGPPRTRGAPVVSVVYIPYRGTYDMHRLENYKFGRFV